MRPFTTARGHRSSADMPRFLGRKQEEDRAKTEVAVQKSRRIWFGRIMGILRSSDLDESAWEQLEEVLISADVGVETSLALVEGLRERAKADSLRNPQEVFQALKEELVSILTADDQGPADPGMQESGDRPHVVLVVGVNGVGKTTSIAKLAFYYQQMGNKLFLAAADTFRAAAIEQLQILGQRANADVIAHRQGADPGAVTYDAVQASRAKGAQVLIVDTAGRLHTKVNLMEELKKVRSVISRLDPEAPHQVLLVLDATTGYNGLSQARAFIKAVNCTGVFLAKLDGTAKGGIVLAVKKELGLPVQYVGTGERIEDMAPFDAQEFIEALLAPLS